MNVWYEMYILLHVVRVYGHPFGHGAPLIHVSRHVSMTDVKLDQNRRAISRYPIAAGRSPASRFALRSALWLLDES